MYEEILKKAGLTSVQTEIYSYLLANGEYKASVLAKEIKRPRGVVYKGLEELIEAGLVEKRDDKNMISRFKAEHPAKLEQLYLNKENRLKEDRQSFINNLPNLVSLYNLINNKSGIKFFEGVEGLKKIYDEILKEGQNLYLIRSAYEPVYQEKIVPIIESFIKKRITKKISVKAITPTDIEKKIKNEDYKILFERIWVEKEKYNAPVEIDIFGNKVAILSFAKELIGMIIESEQIAQSFKQLFALAALGAQNKNPKLTAQKNNKT